LDREIGPEKKKSKLDANQPSGITNLAVSTTTICIYVNIAAMNVGTSEK